MRVSTGRQAESDLSIPDQRRQIAAYYVAKGWDVAAEFVEPGNTATDDRRPAFQAMIDAALVKPPTFTVIVVHAFSRFFRDQFQFEFYVRKPPAIREKFNTLAEQLCISSITLGELHYCAEKSARRAENLTAIEHFVARLEVLPFGDKAAAHYGQVRAELERAGTPCGPHDMQIGAHARSEGLIVVTDNMREFARMPGVRVENWL